MGDSQTGRQTNSNFIGPSIGQGSKKGKTLLKTCYFVQFKFLFCTLILKTTKLGCAPIILNQNSEVCIKMPPNLTQSRVQISNTWIAIHKSTFSQITLSNFLWNSQIKTFLQLEFLPSGKPQSFCLHFLHYNSLIFYSIENLTVHYFLEFG